MEDIQMFVFFTESEFWKTTRAFQKKGKVWIHGNVEPSIKKSDFPVVLNVDNKSMMCGIISIYTERYFSDTEFVKLFNYYKKLHRIKKIERINNKI